MKRKTHDELTRAAKVAGHKSLPDWLDSGRVVAGAGQGESRSPRLDADVCATVRGHAAQVTAALSSISEMLDNEHKKIAANPKALKALHTVRQEYRRFLERLRTVGLEDMTMTDPIVFKIFDHVRRNLEVMGFG
jgi:hypothetical protein